MLRRVTRQELNDMNIIDRFDLSMLQNVYSSAEPQQMPSSTTNITNKTVPLQAVSNKPSHVLTECRTGKQESTRAHVKTRDTWTAFEAFLAQRIPLHSLLSSVEAAKLVDDLHALRQQCCRHKYTSGSISSNYVQVVITGFAKQPLRNLFFRALRYATKAKLIYGAYVNTGTAGDNSMFEIFVGMHVLNISPLANDVEYLFNYLDNFKMSISCIDVGEKTLMLEPQEPSSHVVSAIERIDNGVRHYGNWTSKRNRPYMLQVRKAIFHRQEILRNEHVLQETGLQFTQGNMLSIFYAHRNNSIQHNALQNEIRPVRNDILQALDLLRRELHRQENMQRWDTRTERTTSYDNLQATLLMCQSRLQTSLDREVWNMLPTLTRVEPHVDID